MSTETILVCILSGTLSATIVSSIKELLMWKLKRKAKIEDDAKECKEEAINAEMEEQHASIEKVLETLNNLEKKVDASCKSSKVLLQDRIKWIVIKHIENEEVSFEDRKLVHEMWNIYHYSLGGNGDLDDIMSIFDELPVKIK